jgi:hypothetical protein
MFKNTSPVSKKTKRVSITKINWLMPFSEINSVYTEKHTKPMNVVREKNAELVNAESGSRIYINTLL